MRTLFLALLLLSSFGCGDVVWLQAQASAVCQSLPAQRFELPAELRGHLQTTFGDALSISRDFTLDPRQGLPAELREAADARLALTSLTVTAAAPTADLAFVDEARASLLAPEGAALAPREFTYRRAEEAPTQLGWSGEPVDLSAWLTAGALHFELAFAGRVPDADAVVVDVELCAQAGLDLGLP